jgi:hypothetical protein
MSKHVAISPAEAADRLAIRELVEAYAHCADRRELVLLFLIRGIDAIGEQLQRVVSLPPRVGKRQPAGTNRATTFSPCRRMYRRKPPFVTTNIEPVSAISNRVSAEEIRILKIRDWRLVAEIGC